LGGTERLDEPGSLVLEVHAERCKSIDPLEQEAVGIGSPILDLRHRCAVALELRSERLEDLLDRIRSTIKLDRGSISSRAEARFGELQELFGIHREGLLTDLREKPPKALFIAGLSRLKLSESLRRPRRLGSAFEQVLTQPSVATSHTPYPSPEREGRKGGANEGSNESSEDQR
jgi:hypothetical protein